MNKNELNTIEKNAISILENFFLQSLNTVLSSLTEKSISIDNITKDLKREDFFNEPFMLIDTEYTGDFACMERLIFKIKDALIFTQLAMGETIEGDVKELDDLHQSVFNEIISQVISSTSTALSSKINKKLEFSFPSLSIFENFDETEPKTDQSSTIILYYTLKVGDLIDSVFCYEVQKNWIDYLKEDVDHIPYDIEETFSSEKESFHEQIKEEKNLNSSVDDFKIKPSSYSGENNRMNDEHYIPHDNFHQKTQPSKHFSSKISEEMPVVQPARFSQIVPGNKSNITNSLDLFLDVPMKLTAVLGRTVIHLKDVLEMSTGSVFELDRFAGKPIDLIINNKLVARGEVIVIDEKFGVRVTETLEDIQKKNREYSIS